MDRDAFILQKCQYDKCEATILIQGPFCTKHTHSKYLAEGATVAVPSFALGRRHPNGIQPSQQLSSHPYCHSPTMARQEEKLGDAITVKTSITPVRSMSDKKQLPAKKVARKTTGPTSMKPSPNPPPSIRNPNFSLIGDDNAVVEGPASSQRPPKKRRLSTDVGREERASPGHTTTLAEINALFAAQAYRLSHSASRDVGSTAASDFALRPKKENSTSLEIPPRHKTRDDRDAPASKSSYKDPSRKQQGSYNTSKAVIDLTGDEDSLPQASQSSRNGVGASFSKTQPRKDGYSAVGSKSAGKSIEVQVPPNQGPNKLISQFNAPRQNEQAHTRKTGSDSVPHSLPKKSNANIASRPTAQGVPEHIQPPPPKFMDAPRQKEQLETARQHSHILEVEKTLGKHGPERYATAPSPAPLPNTASINGVNGGPRPASNGKSGAQKVPSAPLEASKTKMNDAPHLSQPVNIDNAHSSARATISKTAATLMSQDLVEGQSSASKPHIPRELQMAPHYFVPSKPRQPSFHEPPELSAPIRPSHNTNRNNEVGQPANITTAVPSPAFTASGQFQKEKSLEEQQQNPITKHDSKKLDSYIYNKQNEPFRPGSASFGVPAYHLPPRPTQSAAAFTYIDPRVHWNHHHSAKWHLEKQRNIRERGTRKTNFGRAAARLAKRKREEGDQAPEMALPERVMSNPQWLAAIDVLEEMEGKMKERRRAKWREDRRERERNAEGQKKAGRKEEAGEAEIGGFSPHGGGEVVEKDDESSVWPTDSTFDSIGD
ncbi:hypothetical protein GGS26DRAFT_542756 [Hypomontagnella submonticulosa]|nr:hypothetical protein GGS26DRAFT_542756 [Hypomontagnella submonticulosa]